MRFEELYRFWMRAQNGGRKSFRFDELDERFFMKFIRFVKFITKFQIEIQGIQVWNITSMEECGKKLALESRLKKVFHLYGYHDIQTPTIEYFDVFREEIGTTPANDLYKFFDKDGIHLS